LDQSKTDRQLIEDLASNMEKLIPRLLPDETLTVAVKTVATTATSTTSIITWKDNK